MSDERPSRVLAVDFGDRRTALASTDWTGTIIVPLETLDGLDDAGCARAIAGVAQERESQLIVVGLPLNVDGSMGPRAQSVRTLVSSLLKVRDLPVAFQDERYSSAEAGDVLRAAGVSRRHREAGIDAAAAAIILQDALSQLEQRP